MVQWKAWFNSMVPVLPDWDCLAMTPAYPVLSPFPKPLKVLCVFHFFALVVWGGGGGEGVPILFSPEGS